MSTKNISLGVKVAGV